MKLVFLLLVALLGNGQAAGPPARRVVLAPLTAAAYRRARAATPVPTEERRFPLRKSKGTIAIQTAAGNKVFRDKKSAVETERVTYYYLGYLPRVRQHLLRKSYWEGEERLAEVVLAVQPDGHVAEFDSEPLYSPSRRYAVVCGQYADYEAMINRLEVVERPLAKPKLLWEAFPATWQPVEVFWATDSTVCIKQELYRSRQTEMHSGVPYKPARYTYARLAVR